MKIATISGNLPHFDKGLGKLMTYVQNVFTELGVEASELNLGMVHPPYFDGIKNTHLDGLLSIVREAEGVVLACSASLFAPSAIMQTFLEYLMLPDYANLLRGKYVALVVISEKGGEKAALQYLSRVVQHMGAYDVTHIGLQAAHLHHFDEGDDAREFVDKELEDFYRTARQNRVYILPQDTIQGGVAPAAKAPARAAQRPAAQRPNPSRPAPARAAAPKAPARRPAPHPVIEDEYDDEPLELAPMTAPRINPIKANKRLDDFTEQQEREIEELSRLFAEKYTDGDEGDDDYATEYEPAYEPEYVDEYEDEPAVFAPKPARPAAQRPAPAPVPKPPAAPPRKKTARQLTQSLPHFFQPQLSTGTQATIQISIHGEEAFEGYLTIVSKECTFTDGESDDPDVTVIADSALWMDVLSGKMTAQKAFMIGGLKVRGALAMFTKFDTLFKMG